MSLHELSSDKLTVIIHGSIILGLVDTPLKNLETKSDVNFTVLKGRPRSRWSGSTSMPLW